MTAAGLELRRDGETLDMLIARGPENRFTTAMAGALVDSVSEFAAEPGARFVRLRAAGDAFCLGREQEGATPDELRQVAAKIVRAHEVLRETPLIVICEVNGDAAGFGVGLVASCDVAIAAEDASFRFPELEAGLAPAVVLSWLAHLVPRKQAFDLVASGRRLTATEALRLGLVTDSVPSGEVAATADRWVRQLGSVDEGALRDVKAFLERVAMTDERTAGRAAADLLALGSLRLRAPS